LKQQYRDYDKITFYYFIETCYPRPIANIYRAMRLYEEPLSKFNSCCFLFEAIIKYCTLLLILGYLSSEADRNPKTDVYLWQFLEEKNTPRSWFEMFKDLLLSYIYSGKEPVIPSIISVYYDKKGNVNKVGRKLDRALFIRDQFGPMGCESLKAAKKYFFELEETSTLLLDRLEFLCDYPLIRPARCEPYKEKFYFEPLRYMGCEVYSEEEEAICQNHLEDSLYLLIPENNNLIDLYPLLILSKCFCNDEHVFFFDSLFGEQINYMFYSAEHSIGVRDVKQIDELFSQGAKLKKRLLTRLKPARKPSAGKTFLKNYRLLSQVGSGGMGRVFRSLQIDRGVIRALKLLPDYLSSNRKWIKALEKEVTKTARIKHDNLVKMTAIGIFPGETFIVNEYVENVTLRDYMDEKKIFTEEEVLRITRQICLGLTNLHRSNVAHRNLKPENILIYKNEEVKIADFGIMKAFEAQSDFLPGFPVKSAIYFSPEHFASENDVGYYSDIYAIGVMLFEMLTGQLPYDFKSYTIVGIAGTILFTRMKSLRELNPKVTEDMENLVLNCLERTPSKRYQDAEELFEDIELLLFYRGLLTGDELQEYKKRKQSEEKLKDFLASIYMKEIPDEERKEIIAGMIKSFEFSKKKVLSIEEEIKGKLAAGELGEFLARPSRVEVAEAHVDEKQIKFPPAIINMVDGAEMILIPEGEFWMGSIEDKDPLARDFEKPGRKILMDPYYIDKYPVTYGQYKRFVEETGYSGEGNWMKYYSPDKANYPVVEVSWNDARAYTKWAGKTLPTEAEWEKAARGTEQREYPWGNKWDQNKCNNKKMNKPDIINRMIIMMANRGTVPVGSFPDGRSPYGVMDMAGNINEWCSDWYDNKYYKVSTGENPSGPSSGSWKVIRGGSWCDADQNMFRCSARYGDHPSITKGIIGFRCVYKSEK